MEQRADGFIMRRQNYSDNDDQIIILHLKDEEREGVAGFKKGLKRMTESLVHVQRARLRRAEVTKIVRKE